MIDVRMIAHTNIDPIELASHAALKCYQAKDPQLGKTIDVKSRLFDVGHHTTLQHWYATFSIEGISVGDITFGMHLAHPFYNSDQRSGRYCAQMFLEPDFGKIDNYIETFWPGITAANRKQAVAYVRQGVEIYHKNISKATEVAIDFIKKERPFVSDKYIEQNGPKIAQEQMRMFIPIIFPTGFDYTLNLVALAALYRTAWTPAMHYVVSKMAEEIVKKFPGLSFMFSPEEESVNVWSIELPGINAIQIHKKPRHLLKEIVENDDFSKPDIDDMHPVDLLHFWPGYMENSTGKVITTATISVATMGQDQRHRTIQRGKSEFTGDFYLPPILSKMKMDEIAEDYMEAWIRVGRKVSPTLSMMLAPYGAMVEYEKVASFNALAHEQAKRLCWCAQEEIYHAGRALRLAIQKKDKKSELLRLFEPPCYRTGKCAEGARYCGRDIKLRNTGDYFPERKV